MHAHSQTWPALQLKMDTAPPPQNKSMSAAVPLDSTGSRDAMWTKILGRLTRSNLNRMRLVNLDAGTPLKWYIPIGIGTLELLLENRAVPTKCSFTSSEFRRQVSKLPKVLPLSRVFVRLG